MEKSRIRTAVEAISVVIILILAGLSFMPAFHGTTQVKLDHDNLSYQGQVKANKFNGKGILKLHNQDYYVGQFKNGRFTGTGQFVSHENWSMQGKFKQGTPDGYGQIKVNDKLIYKGNLKDGKLVNAN